MFFGNKIQCRPIVLHLLIIALLGLQQESVWCFQTLDTSASSSLHGRFASQRSFSPNVWKAARAEEDMSGLFPGKGPYVPCGLSEAEYQKIKEREADELKSKNFGAWGPRFRQSKDAEENWLFMPALWTNGASYRPESQMVGTESTQTVTVLDTVRTKLIRVYGLMKQAAPGFILGCILLDCLATATILLKSAEWTIRKSLLTIFKLTFVMKKPLLVTSVMRDLAIGILSSIALSPFMNNFLEQVNRKRLWSRRRTLRISAAFAYGSLLVLAGALHVYTAWL